MAKAPTTKTINGTKRDDILNGTQLAETINGQQGDDVINGNGGNDTLNGNAGHDVMDGGLGDDLLIGGIGQDQLTGGLGRDVFRYASYSESNAVSGTDTIADFNPADDRIDLTAIGPIVMVGAYRPAYSTVKQATLVYDSQFDRTTLSVYNGSSSPAFQLYINGNVSSLTGIAGIIAPPPPTVTIGDVTVNEAAGTMTFTVTRSGIGLTEGSSTVNFATSDISASAGSDYLASSGTVEFAVGQTSRTIVIDISEDFLPEASQTFKVTLSGGTNVTIADAEAIGTIADNDSPTSGNDILLAADDNGVTIDALAGDDQVTGGAGADILIGGLGADVLAGGAGGDTFRYLGFAESNASGGIDTILDFNPIDGDRIGLATISGWTTGLFVGSAYQPSISFAQLTLNHDANANQTTLAIFLGSSTPLFELQLSGQHGSIEGIVGVVPAILGTSGDDPVAALTGTAAGDYIFGLEGNDTLSAGGGDDYVSGGAGNDTLDGGTGTDIVDGGSGEDFYSGLWFMQATSGVTFTLTDNVTVATDHGVKTLIDIEQAFIVGSSHNDAFTGGSRILAGAGDDLLIGGSGGDGLSGGPGADTFRYLAYEDSLMAGGQDIIFDFNRAEGDVIDLSALGAMTLVSAYQPDLAEQQMTLVYNGSWTTMTIYNGSSSPVMELTINTNVSSLDGILF